MVFSSPKYIFHPKNDEIRSGQDRRKTPRFQSELFKARDYEEVREVIPRIGPIPNVIPLKLFLDMLRDPVFPRGSTDSQSYVPIFSTVDS